MLTNQLDQRGEQDEDGAENNEPRELDSSVDVIRASCSNTLFLSTICTPLVAESAKIGSRKLRDDIPEVRPKWRDVWHVLQKALCRL